MYSVVYENWLDSIEMYEFIWYKNAEGDVVYTLSHAQNNYNTL